MESNWNESKEAFEKLMKNTQGIKRGEISIWGAGFGTASPKTDIMHRLRMEAEKELNK